jgi:hypothetical protein
MRTSLTMLGAWVWVALQAVQALWYGSMAWHRPGEADYDAPVSMVYMTAMLTAVISACVSMSLLVILGRQEGRIRQLEQLANQPSAARQPGDSP